MNTSKQNKNKNGIASSTTTNHSFKDYSLFCMLVIDFPKCEVHI